ncbi:hypothetical protein NJH77_12755 [Serratia fonticola]|uniref:hypothetical protein n=1 Tax=Serratia fonticola TaxID=47917 RepID=UPI002096EC39|nr:hypothetical protein [Serratia fonticola]MCO7510120.1 hypothetical protein [Serratia fonticola]
MLIEDVIGAIGKWLFPMTAKIFSQIVQRLARFLWQNPLKSQRMQPIWRWPPLR